MKHKHYDMIVAKAENMDLVVFINSHGEWVECIHSGSMPIFSDSNDYFLCLPKHKEACLHWLNGGDIQYHLMGESYDYHGKIQTTNWSKLDWYMQDDKNVRIKPKKEKRWIYISDNGYLGGAHYESVDELKSRVHAPSGFDGWQFIEIEVEV